MQTVFVAKGSGYADDHSFDNFEVLAEPVSRRDDRVFGRTADNRFDGTDYGSHSIKLAARKGEISYKGIRDLYILMQHGGGTEVLRIPTFYDRGDFERALLGMPERVLYATLYTLYQIARYAHDTAQSETAGRYAKAFVAGHLKKSRRDKFGRCRVTIETPTLIENVA